MSLLAPFTAFHILLAQAPAPMQAPMQDDVVNIEPRRFRGHYFWCDVHGVEVYARASTDPQRAQVQRRVHEHMDGTYSFEHMLRPNMYLCAKDFKPDLFGITLDRNRDQTRAKWNLERCSDGWFGLWNADIQRSKQALQCHIYRDDWQAVFCGKVEQIDEYEKLRFCHLG